MMALAETTVAVTTSRPAAHEETAPETTDNKRSTKQRQPQQHEPGQSSRTSLTGSITDSWMSSASSPTGGGVEVPPLLQSLFGLDFLPYSTILEDEAGEARAAAEEVEETKGVPRSVEIKSEGGGESDGHHHRSTNHNDNDSDTVSFNEQGEVCAVHRHCPTRVPTPEREELQEMLLHAQGGPQHKKKRPGKRIKAAVKGVFHKFGSVRRRRGGGSLAAASTSASLKSNLTVNTRNALPPSSPLTTTTEASVTPLNDNNNNSNNNNFSSSIHNGEQSCLQKQVQLQEESVQKTQQEIEQLQQSLAASIEKYQAQLLKLQQTQQELQQKAAQANAQKSVLHTSCPANLNFETINPSDAASEPAAIVRDENPRVLKRSESASYMRVSDLDLIRAALAAKESPSLSSLSQSAHSTNHAKQQETAVSVDDRTPEFLLMDHYLLEIVQQLILKGYHLITDEGDRFVPTKDTEKLLMQKPTASNGGVDPSWPIHPWTASWDQHVLVWTGHVAHEGFGSKWPVVKGRTILFASARTVLEYLWDSSQVPKYNPMSQGRSDVYTLQDNVETAAHESPYGLAGCAKIVQSVNKHRLLPKGIEMKSLLYARPLEEHTGSYILVSRSVWENSSATMPESHSKNVIRSEMLLGCTLLRAIGDQKCEMTQLTHAYSPGVPEMLVRRTAPGQCSTLMKAMQAQFPPPK